MHRLVALRARQDEARPRGGAEVPLEFRHVLEGVPGAMKGGAPTLERRD